jgi:hypothetical protein
VCLIIHWRYLVRRYISTNSMISGCDIQITEMALMVMAGQDSATCIATRYGLDGPGMESRWW